MNTAWKRVMKKHAAMKQTGPMIIEIMGEDGLPWDEDALERENEKCVLAIINSRCAKKPRPRTHATHRSETIKAMRIWRIDGGSLKQFLQSAAQGGPDGPTILPGAKMGCYSVDCEVVLDSKGAIAGKDVAEGTLKDWWREAGQPGK